MCACRPRVLLALTVFCAATPALAQAPHSPFSVMTYNVRHVTADDTGKFDWFAREDAVLGLVRKRDPDVFGLQESSSEPIQAAFVSAFESDYDRYHPPNGSPKIIFFRRGRFQRSDRDDVEGFFAFENPYSESEACYKNAGGRTAAWVWLTDLESQREYLVINLHVAHAAACSKAREQAAEKVRAFIAEQAPDSVIVFGDFNIDDSRHDEATLETMEAQREGLRLFRTARHSGETTSGTATFNSGWKSTGVGKSRLDYIFIGGSDIASMRQVVDQSTVNGISPSDHFPVLATVRHGLFEGAALKAEQPGTAQSDVAFGDINGDGAADKVVLDPSIDEGRPQVYLSLRDGSFSAEPFASQSGARAAEGARFFYADVNGDLCDDELSWQVGVDGGALAVALSRCDGTFELASLQRQVADAQGRAEYHFADIDGDGCSDWMAWNPGQHGGHSRVALSACDGSFASAIVNSDDGASTNTDAHVYLADFDGDGAADKLLWDKDAKGGKTQLYRSNRDGTFAFHSLHSGGSSGVASSRFYFGDFDGDGFADKVFWRHSFRQGHPQIYMGSADGFIAHPTMGNQGVSTSASHRYLFADIDANGSDDLVAWDPSRDHASTRAYLALADGTPPPVHREPGSGDDAAMSNRDAAPRPAQSDAGPDAELEGVGLSSGGCRLALRSRGDSFPAMLGLLLVLWRRR